MKKLIVITLVALLFCGCEKTGITPDLTMASYVRHSLGEEFYPGDYCKVKSFGDDPALVTYEGELDVYTEGDYKIVVTADNGNGGKVSKDVTVEVRENRSSIDNETACRNLNSYIKNIIKNGMTNIGNSEYAEGLGNIASAFSVNGAYEYDGLSGELIFECYRTEEKRQSALNMVFWVDEKAVRYIPYKFAFVAGDTRAEFAVSEEASNNGRYGCYVNLDEYIEDSGTRHPDYIALEKLRNIVNYTGDVTMEAIGTSGSYNMVLTPQHKTDFLNVFNIYEEMLLY